jgi:hypothetical protein
LNSAQTISLFLGCSHLEITDISEEPAASIFRVEIYPEGGGTTSQLKRSQSKQSLPRKLQVSDPTTGSQTQIIIFNPKLE